MSHTRIRSCHVHDFRNYQELHCDCDASFIVFTGSNGAGKTNILEALSLLSQGKGFRSARPEEQLRIGAQHGWSVQAEIATPITTHYISTGVTTGAQKRRVLINDAPASQHDMSDIVDILWFLPTTSHLFSENSTAQRKYFDRMVCGFDREHAKRIYSYEHYMRERNKLLMMRADALWMASLEQKMAEYSVAIASARLDMVAHINESSALVSDAFPHARLELIGDAETLLQHHTALHTESAIRDMLEHARVRDAQTKRASHGAHKSRFSVYYTAKNMVAHQCSTGEQKALLMTLLLAQIYAQTRWNQRAPVLLLDEMVAHLDEHRRAVLFEVLSDAQIQCFATGTDRASFHALNAYDTKHYIIQDGRILM